MDFFLILSPPDKTSASLKRKMLLRVKPNKKSLMKRKYNKSGGFRMTAVK